MNKQAYLIIIQTTVFIYLLQMCMNRGVRESHSYIKSTMNQLVVQATARGSVYTSRYRYTNASTSARPMSYKAQRSFTKIVNDLHTKLDITYQLSLLNSQYHRPMSRLVIGLWYRFDHNAQVHVPQSLKEKRSRFTCKLPQLRHRARFELQNVKAQYKENQT